MTLTEIPQMATANYTSNLYTPTMAGLIERQFSQAPGSDHIAAMVAQQQRMQSHVKETPMADKPKLTRRLVQVIIADPDDMVPLDQALLYHGAPIFTDLTDEEMFFELDIKTMLKAHNDKRVKLFNKKVKERTEYLEPVKVRDLKMVVVEIAKF